MDSYKYATQSEGLQAESSTASNDTYGRNADGGFHGLPWTPSSSLPTRGNNMSPYDQNFDRDIPIPSVEENPEPQWLLTQPVSWVNKSDSPATPTPAPMETSSEEDSGSDSDSDLSYDEAQARDMVRLDTIERKLWEFKNAGYHYPSKAVRHRVAKSRAKSAVVRARARARTRARATKPTWNTAMAALGVEGQLNKLSTGFCGVKWEEIGVEDPFRARSESMDSVSTVSALGDEEKPPRRLPFDPVRDVKPSGRLPFDPVRDDAAC